MNTTSPPDMTKEHAAEIKALRKEEGRLIKAEGRRERYLAREIERLQKQADKRKKKADKVCRAVCASIDRETAKLTRPLSKEWTRRTAGEVVNDRLNAVRGRIAILEGRLTS